MNWNLQSRFTLAALIPAIFIAVALASLFIYYQKHDFEQHLKSHGESIAKQISAASAFALTESKIELLKPILSAALTVPNVKSVTIINNAGSVVLRADTAKTVNSDLPLGDNALTASLIFMRPILSSKSSKVQRENPRGANESSESSGGVIGWIMVELDNGSTMAQEHIHVFDSIAVTLVILFIAVIMVLRITKKVTQPILQIAEAANEIKKGNFDIALNSNTSGELLTLERSIKGMAQSLKHSRDKLQVQVDQATGELLTSIQVVERQNKELGATRQKAVLASKVKSEFLANMSHEIRTPMNGVLGFLKLLRKTSLTPEQIDYINTIEQSADALLSIINDILDISKIEAGKVKLRLDPYDLRECLESVVSLLAPTAYEKQVELVHIIYNDVPINLVGDESKLRQIITNLTGNALKFTEHGEVVIRVMVDDFLDKSVKIRISVSDTGVGINEKDQQRLFSNFEQADTSSTRKFGGTGLGLSISKTLTELMQGEVGIESRPGKGSTFWFTVIQNIPEITSPRERLSNDRKLSLLIGINVVVYDANQASQLAIKHLLNKLGLELTLFNQRESAIKQAKSLHTKESKLFVVFSLSNQDLLSDSLANQISELKKLENILLVTLINSADPNELNKIKQLGVDASLSKPLRYQDAVNAFCVLVTGGKIDKSANMKNNSQQDIDPNVPQPMITNRNNINPLDGIRVLVAEDNAINAKLVNTLLKQAGAEIKVVGNGRLAVEAVKTNNFDIVLMDIHMPDMNGIDATKEIRNLQSNLNGIPIIALTADAMPDDRTNFADAGITDSLIKPIDEATLINVVSSHTTIHPRPIPNNITSIFKRNTSTQRNTAPLQPETNKPLTSVVKPGDTLTKELFEMLVKELPSFQVAINTAYVDQEITELEEQAHKLHGAASYCEVPKLKEAIKQLERAAKAKEILNIKPCLDAVNTEITLLLQSTNYG